MSTTLQACMICGALISVEKLNSTIYLSIIADQVHLIILMALMNGNGCFQQGNASGHNDRTGFRIMRETACNHQICIQLRICTTSLKKTSTTFKSQVLLSVSSHHLLTCREVNAKKNRRRIEGKTGPKRSTVGVFVIIWPVSMQTMENHSRPRLSHFVFGDVPR